MNIKDIYREETDKDVYLETTGLGGSGESGSYTDEYVRWLENRLVIPKIASLKDKMKEYEIYYDGYTGYIKIKDAIKIAEQYAIVFHLKKTLEELEYSEDCESLENNKANLATEKGK